MPVFVMSWAQVIRRVAAAGHAEAGQPATCSAVVEVGLAAAGPWRGFCDLLRAGRAADGAVRGHGGTDQTEVSAKSMVLVVPSLLSRRHRGKQCDGLVWQFDGELVLSHSLSERPDARWPGIHRPFWSWTASSKPSVLMRRHRSRSTSARISAS
ncbi:MAG TPA: hypothetical protein VGP26_30575 [Actinophytocola sp.]|nr:hypothetical protein [Actinophytocola sp.]